MTRANPEALNLNLVHIISLLLQKFNPLKAIFAVFRSFLCEHKDLGESIEKIFYHLP